MDKVNKVYNRVKNKNIMNYKNYNKIVKNYNIKIRI